MRDRDEIENWFNEVRRLVETGEITAAVACAVDRDGTPHVPTALPPGSRCADGGTMPGSSCRSGARW